MIFVVVSFLEFSGWHSCPLLMMFVSVVVFEVFSRIS